MIVVMQIAGLSPPTLQLSVLPATWSSPTLHSNPLFLLRPWKKHAFHAATAGIVSTLFWRCCGHLTDNAFNARRTRGPIFRTLRRGGRPRIWNLFQPENAKLQQPKPAARVLGVPAWGIEYFGGHDILLPARKRWRSGLLLHRLGRRSESTLARLRRRRLLEGISSVNECKRFVRRQRRGARRQNARTKDGPAKNKR